MTKTPIDILIEAIKKFGFTGGILWSGGAKFKFESGIGTFAEASKDVSFPLGIGMPGRVLMSKTYEWNTNVQKMHANKFIRLISAKELGIKTVLSVSVKDGIIELSSTDEKAEDTSIILAMKEMF
mmetsp:Transcript_65409/g.55495  ORF Transcript_65409/g.55495 Transcript_65409/m.55495 type:complete len:125 (+) Transcript_65409:184-558(+)